MFGFDDIFDFDHEGSLDAFERDAEFQFVYGMTKSGASDSFDDDDDVFAEAGLDYDELEYMDPEERREVLEDAGLDPDEFDF